jgi:hypothetical protein
MYRGLTTNLPREIMGFSDFAFSTAAMAGSSMDARRYPCSEEVRVGGGLVSAGWCGIGSAAGDAGRVSSSTRQQYADGMHGVARQKAGDTCWGMHVWWGSCIWH